MHSLSSCKEVEKTKRANGLKAPVFPNYSGCVIPVNIAPLNFEIMKRCDEVEAVFFIKDEKKWSCNGEQYINIPEKKWRKLVEEASKNREEIKIMIACRNGSKWDEYLPITFNVASEPIDEWIAYRLIFPGYEGWSHMGLFQRNLTSFSEKTILDNTMTGKNCMNCHSFHQNNPEKFLFHMRGSSKGTVLVEDGGTKMIRNGMNGKSIPLTYSSWHPSGKYIAFSSNTTHQFFHATTEKLIEVYDERSDVVLYDVNKQKITTDSSLLAHKAFFETYPTWSPTGDRLFFCRMDSVSMPNEFKSIQYSICSVGFDTLNGVFYGPVDMVLSIPNKSIVFPRISPDGRYLLAATLDYGCFPSWHRESDIIVWDLEKKKLVAHDANSFDSETYPSWSSNGRWVMFGSRRMDGLFTRIWFSYVSEDGRLFKPFLLPQKDLRDIHLKSYNVAEFIKKPVTIPTRKLFKALSSEL